VCPTTSFRGADLRCWPLATDIAVQGNVGCWGKNGSHVANRRAPAFAIITVPPNELVAQIHNRMPAILGSADYERWLGDESDPHDLLRPFPSELMRMWPISTRVNKPENDEPSILEPMTTLVA